MTSSNNRVLKGIRQEKNSGDKFDTHKESCQQSMHFKLYKTLLYCHGENNK